MNQRYEYDVSSVGGSLDDERAHLNSRAREGWRLVSVKFFDDGDNGTSYIYWEREVPEGPRRADGCDSCRYEERGLFDHPCDECRPPCDECHSPEGWTRWEPKP